MNIKDLIFKLSRGERGVSKCPHFQECGGCFFHIPYKKQLRIKQDALKILDFNFKIIPSPKIWYYRNRMDYVCAFDKIGLRKEGSWKEIVEIKECKLLSKGSNLMLRKIRRILEEKDIPFYDFINHSGYLRYIVFREGKFTNERMISFVTYTNEKKILDVVNKINSESIVWILNDTLSDVSFGKILYFKNKDFIYEKLGKVKYIIKPNCFFQTNPFQAVRIFRKIKEIVKGAKNVLDLFCGVGSISLFISDCVSNVEGIEILDEAVECAQMSAKVNDIKNVKFLVGDARKIPKKKYDFVILDPPRGGLGKKLCKKLNSFKKIIYMSCNPISQKEDLKYLKHKIIEGYAFDMLPHTPHIETLLVLEKAGVA